VKKFDSSDKPLIYLITDGETTDENYTERKSEILKLIETAIQAEISLIQIREKRLSTRLIFQLAKESARLTRKTGTKLLINDRADIALAAKADGVHLTVDSLSAEIIRRSFPKKFIVGVSAHTVEEAETAKSQGANFITFSPVFSSPGKGEPQGIEKLREVCERLDPFPVVALSGINETNYTEILETGASGFAAIRFLNNEKNLRKLATIYTKKRTYINER
jgi:thiamine-phosphate pyrophosphorylase